MLACGCLSKLSGCLATAGVATSEDSSLEVDDGAGDAAERSIVSGLGVAGVAGEASSEEGTDFDRRIKIFLILRVCGEALAEP